MKTTQVWGYLDAWLATDRRPWHAMWEAAASSLSSRVWKTHVAVR
jgi:hypothetical protein